jgi:hypothetical protein
MAIKIRQGNTLMDGGSCNSCGKYPIEPTDMTILAIDREMRQVSRLCTHCAHDLSKQLKSFLTTMKKAKESAASTD